MKLFTSLMGVLFMVGLWLYVDTEGTSKWVGFLLVGSAIGWIIGATGVTPND